MTDATPRLALPLIAAGQAQKELFHNEALTRIDLLVHGAVAGPPQDAPPADPQPGEAWLVGAAPGGAWAGHADSIAGWGEAGWRFVTPREGMALWVTSAGCRALRRNMAWEIGVIPATSLRIGGVQVVGARAAAVPDAVGGTTIDGEARATLAMLLARLRDHGLIAT